MEKYALLIGIDYIVKPNRLNGCHRDIELLQQVLVEKFNYTNTNITILIDSDDSQHKPNRKEILT